MSQPLTGIVRRRLGDLSAREAVFLFALADMIPAGTREWSDTWAALTRKVKRRWPSGVRHTAYALRNRGFLQIKSTGRGVTITLRPEDGRALFLSPGDDTKPGTQTAGKSVTQSAGESVTQSARTHTRLDRPPITPFGRNAPQTPAPGSKVVSTSKGGEGLGNGKPSPLGSEKGPGKPMPPKLAPASKRCRPSPSDKISLEREIGRLIKEIDRVRDRHESAEDWTDQERLNVKRWKLRVDECCRQIDNEPVYNVSPS